MAVEFTIDDVKALYDKFRKYDANRDRTLSRVEILYLLREEIINASEREVDWFLEMIDLPIMDKNVKVTFPQFVRGMGEFEKVGSRIEFHPGGVGTAVQLVAAKGLTWHEVDRVYTQFLKADTNKSGTLSLNEISEVFRKVVPNMSPANYADEFARIDKNKSGYVDFIEFLEWISRTNKEIVVKGQSQQWVPTNPSRKAPTKTTSVRLRSRNHSLAVKMAPAPVNDGIRADAFKAFSAMDNDANGQLSEEEFTNALEQALGRTVTRAEINRLYYVVDSDGSGSITFDEFLYAVAHYAEITKAAANLKTEFGPKFEWEIPYSELQFGAKIGEGTFGVVYQGKWHGTPVAIKKLKFSAVTAAVLDEFKKEVAMLAKLRHPNVVLFMGACTQPPNLCIVTEYLEGGSVYGLLHKRKTAKKVSIQTKHRIALQTARGLNYLHNIGMIHRDLKSLNLLLDDNYVCKVCDFGLSCMKPKSNEPLLNQQVGSPLWMAPELLRSAPYSEKVDVYSYAMCLWELETHKLPFDTLEFEDLIRVVNSGKRPDIPVTASPIILSLIMKCWEGSPDKRPTFGKIVEQLEQARNN